VPRFRKFVGSPVEAAAIGDVTGDARPDVVAMTAGSLESGARALSVFVFRQPEAGLLGAPRQYSYAEASEGTGGSDLVLADLDEDGIQDVVIAVYDGFVALRADGAGGLLPAEAHKSGDGSVHYSWQLAVLDVDLDGHLDVVTTGGSDVPPDHRVYFGDGRGGFPRDTSPDQADLLSAFLSELEVADLNGDGRQDLATLRTGVAGDQLRMARQDGLGTLVSWGAYSVPQNEIGKRRAAALALGDVNGDGRDDVVVSADGDRLLDRLWIQTQTQQHVYTCPQLVPTAEQPGSVAIADLDGDQRMDVLVQHPKQLGFYLQKPNGLLEPEQMVPFESGMIQPIGNLAVGDLYPDGCLDAVLAAGHEGLVVFYGCGGPPIQVPLGAGVPVVLLAAGCGLGIRALRARQRAARRAGQPPPGSDEACLALHEIHALSTGSLT
jgi:hypothetical protein